MVGLQRIPLLEKSFKGSQIVFDQYFLTRTLETFLYCVLISEKAYV